MDNILVVVLCIITLLVYITLEWECIQEWECMVLLAVVIQAEDIQDNIPVLVLVVFIQAEDIQDNITVLVVVIQVSILVGVIQDNIQAGIQELDKGNIHKGVIQDKGNIHKGLILGNIQGDIRMQGVNKEVHMRTDQTRSPLQKPSFPTTVVITVDTPELGDSGKECIVCCQTRVLRDYWVLLVSAKLVKNQEGS